MKLLVPGKQKLVAFLQNSLNDEVSGKKLRRLLEANVCRVNGRIERFGSAHLERGDVVELAPSWKSAITEAPPKFTTLYEDTDLLLIDKPAGWVCSEENCRRTFGPDLKLVHRLDKDTTGVLALAKSASVLNDLIDLFSKRGVEKEYLAIVDGVPKENAGTRESYLVRKRQFQGQTIWGSGSNGQHAITNWRVLRRAKDAALLLCEPITGRTHQIRVHLSEAGHPILVDRQYASTFRCTLFARRPLLHAFRLRLGTAFAEAPLPLDMQNFIPSLIHNASIHKQPQESGICQGGALNFSQALPAPKQLNLNKLSDAGGLKSSGCPTTAETDS